MNNIWTIDELVDAVWNTEQIDDYYLSKDADWSWASTDEIQNETWLPCPGIKNTWASNLGHIKIGNKIARICEKHAPDEQLGAETLHKLIQNKQPHGWLIVPELNNEYLYRLIAAAWLGNKLSGYEIHHISNDGYDCSPQNLIYLFKCDHDKIPSNGKIKDKKYKR